jgi:hypothetical protein
MLATAPPGTRRVAAGVALGSARFAIAAGHTTDVAVKLGRTAVRLLSKLPRLRARAHVIARGGTDAGAPTRIELLPERSRPDPGDGLARFTPRDLNIESGMPS